MPWLIQILSLFQQKEWGFHPLGYAVKGGSLRRSSLENMLGIMKTPQKKSHAVAQLKPLIVDGKAFYDLHGGVWECVQDAHQEKLERVIISTGFSWVLRGGGWHNFARDTRSAISSIGTPRPSNDVGFRLVREVRNP